MKVYNVARTLYLDTNASSISLGAGLLQVRDSMNFGHEEILDNAILQPTVFASQGLTSVGSWDLTWNRKILIITNYLPLVAMLSIQL